MPATMLTATVTGFTLAPRSSSTSVLFAPRFGTHISFSGHSAEMKGCHGYQLSGRPDEHRLSKNIHVFWRDQTLNLLERGQVSAWHWPPA